MKITKEMWVAMNEYFEHVDPDELYNELVEECGLRPEITISIDLEDEPMPRTCIKSSDINYTDVPTQEDTESEYHSLANAA
mgnify:CR=1 FL=1